MFCAPDPNIVVMGGPLSQPQVCWNPFLPLDKSIVRKLKIKKIWKESVKNQILY
jgi:hypothetical protein